MVVIFFLLFRPFKKFKVSPRNLYAAAKECNIHKVLAVLGKLHLATWSNNSEAGGRNFQIFH